MENEILTKIQEIKEKFDKRKTPWAKFISLIEKILIPSALVTLAIVTHNTSTKLTESQLELTRIQQVFDRERDGQIIKNDQQELDLLYLNLFYKELTKKNNDTENTLKLLALMNNDLQLKLAEWIKTNDNYDVETQNKAKDIINRIGPLGSFKIGVYYLIVDKNAESKAQKVASKLRLNSIGNSIQIYPKNSEFFKKVNPPTTNEIRYEPNYENSASLQLIKSLDELFPDYEFKRKTVGNRTTNFISIFVK